jgi:hypothetical protein
MNLSQDDDAAYPVLIRPIEFQGGPFDGQGILEVRDPGFLEISSIEIPERPEGSYQRGPEGKYHWRLQQ